MKHHTPVWNAEFGYVVCGDCGVRLRPGQLGEVMPWIVEQCGVEEPPTEPVTRRMILPAGTP